MGVGAQFTDSRFSAANNLRGLCARLAAFPQRGKKGSAVETPDTSLEPAPEAAISSSPTNCEGAVQS